MWGGGSGLQLGRPAAAAIWQRLWINIYEVESFSAAMSYNPGGTKLMGGSMRNMLVGMCPDFEAGTECSDQRKPGDRVMIGSNLGPVYEIIHIAGPKAWVRMLSGGADGIADVDNLRFCEAHPDAEAWYNRDTRAAA
jgi:hypothetical protein